MMAIFVRSVGDKVTADMIRKYIEYQIHENNSIQLPVFENIQIALQQTKRQFASISTFLLKYAILYLNDYESSRISKKARL